MFSNYLLISIGGVSFYKFIHLHKFVTFVSEDKFRPAPKKVQKE